MNEKILVLQMQLKEERKRRQQAEQQLLQIQHGFLPATSPQGSPLLATSALDSPLLATSALDSPLQHGTCQVRSCNPDHATHKRVYFSCEATAHMSKSELLGHHGIHDMLIFSLW